MLTALTDSQTLLEVCDISTIDIFRYYGHILFHKIFENFGDRPLFMWDDDPYSGVFKNPETAKWYGIIMYIPRSRLGEKSAAYVQVMNLKLDVDEIQKLLKHKGFYPAYHMNKKYWISLTLDEKLSDDEILALVEESHCYTVSKSKKKC